MKGERANLEEELREARERLGRLKESLQQEEVEFDGEDIDPNMYEREKSVVLIGSLERKVASLERALEMLDKGQYGRCERCGQLIDPARLEILPEATLCVKCQAEVEKLRKRGLA